MNWDQIEGKWKELKGEIRQKWADMTDSDYEKIGGKKDELSGWLQKKYGYSKDQIEREIDSFGHGAKEYDAQNDGNRDPALDETDNVHPTRM